MSPPELYLLNLLAETTRELLMKAWIWPKYQRRKEEERGTISTFKKISKLAGIE